MAGREIIVAPSILSGDFARLADEADGLVQAGADWLHVDVMDGHFVPNMTLGPCVVKSLRAATKLPLDCHLMIMDPEAYAPRFAEAGADLITFHVEATTRPRELARRIRGLGVKAGLAVKPTTPIEHALEVADEFDLILVMTVEPGFGGQRFMASMMDKVARAATECPPRVDIEVDGGIDAQTVGIAAAAGANVFVSGSAIFRALDRSAAIRDMRQTALAAGSRLPSGAAKAP